MPNARCLVGAFSPTGIHESTHVRETSAGITAGLAMLALQLRLPLSSLESVHRDFRTEFFNLTCRLGARYHIWKGNLGADRAGQLDIHHPPRPHTARYANPSCSPTSQHGAIPLWDYLGTGLCSDRRQGRLAYRSLTVHSTRCQKYQRGLCY